MLVSGDVIITENAWMDPLRVVPTGASTAAELKEGENTASNRIMDTKGVSRIYSPCCSGFHGSGLTRL